ncbi:hypothetical protein BDQ17DRAFT_1454654 [Cyathus striatus]|nr:hypothetical protein BDQ17DRAFT_1454654 [Cyathus striatus]
MPLDVLYEIFGMLDPLDLVQLTRTTKAIRKCSRNSALWVWIHSRSNVNRLPECPNDMTEWLTQHLCLKSIVLDVVIYPCRTLLGLPC